VSEKLNKILLLTILLLFVACTNRPREVLKPGKMAEIITDLHKTDGLIAVLRNGNEAPADSVQKKYYAAVLEKYKLTQNVFDSSLVWYSKNPKRFEAVYIKVEKNLLRWQTEIETGKFGKIENPLNTITLWSKDNHLIIKDTSDYKNIKFDIKSSDLLKGDVFDLRFYQKNDSTKLKISPKIVLKINYADSITDSVSAISHTDGLTRRFRLKLPATRNAKINSIAGNLLLIDSINTKFVAVFDSILLTRTYNILSQDSLHKTIQQPTDFHPQNSDFEQINRGALRTKIKIKK
jgi:hypothetical protein